jgi:hypothetical protein
MRWSLYYRLTAELDFYYVSRNRSLRPVIIPRLVHQGFMIYTLFKHSCLSLTTILEISHFLWNWRLITVLTRARHWTVSCVIWMKSASWHHISLWTILIISCHLGLGLPSCFSFQFFFCYYNIHISYLPMRSTSDIVLNVSRWFRFSKMWTDMSAGTSKMLLLSH